MNMEFIIANASQLLVVVAVICTLISVKRRFVYGLLCGVGE